MEQPQVEAPRRDYESRTKRFIWFGVLTMAAGITFAWQVHPGWGVGLGAVSLAFFIVLLLSSSPNLSRNLSWILWSLVLIGFLALIGLPGGHPATDLGRSNCVRGNIERFRVTVERYYADNGTYPLSVSQLRDLDYLPVLPQNPFASKLYRLGYAAGGDKHAESYIGMHPIGESTGPIDGKFAYLPQLAANEEGNLFVSGYKLVGFGREKYPGMKDSLSCEITILSSEEPYCLDSRDSSK